MDIVAVVVVAFWVMLPAYIPNNVAVLAGGGRPIDGGRTLGGSRLLGDGKTWRGTAAGTAAREAARSVIGARLRSAGPVVARVTPPAPVTGRVELVVTRRPSSRPGKLDQGTRIQVRVRRRAERKPLARSGPARSASAWSTCPYSCFPRTVGLPYRCGCSMRMERHSGVATSAPSTSPSSHRMNSCVASRSGQASTWSSATRNSRR